MFSYNNRKVYKFSESLFEIIFEKDEHAKNHEITIEEFYITIGSAILPTYYTTRNVVNWPCLVVFSKVTDYKITYESTNEENKQAKFTSDVGNTNNVDIFCT